MTLGTNGSTLNDELNRLANGGTYRNMDQMVDEALAAKQWANREYINPYSTDTVGILNEIAGLGLNKKNWFDFNGVCNYLAGTTGLPAAAALRQIQNTSDLITSNATYYVDANNFNTPGYVYLSGTSGNYMSVPDSNDLDITGDIDLRAQIALDNWSFASNQTIIAKFQTVTTDSYYLVMLGGFIVLLWSPDGSTASQVQKQSTVAVPFENRQIGWIRATRSATTGDCYFYTSTNGTTWTQLGTVLTSTPGNLFSSTSQVEIGSNRSGTFGSVAGKIYRAQILNGIDGTAVLDANMAGVSQPATSFLDSTGKTVTINGVRLTAQDVDNLGTGRDLLPTTVGSSTAADSNDPKFLDFTGTNYVYTPGVLNNNISLPDGNDLDITGDLDVRAFLALDDWTPSASQDILSKWGASGNYSWVFRVNTTGTIALYWSNNGTSILFSDSTVAVPITDGSPLWVRATLDVDNGASGRDVKFFTSTNGSTWTQLGSTVTSAGVTSIFNSNAIVLFGASSVSTTNTAGKLFRAQIFNGIDGTKVLDVDTSVITSGADTYVVPVTYTGQAGAYFTGTGLSLNGVAGNYVSTPDANTLDITGDLDVQVKVALADWTPGAISVLANKWSTSGNFSYTFYVKTDGTLVLAWTADGSTSLNATSTATGITDGATKWVRATLDVNNGASGRDIKFYTSDDGSTWTQLGTTVTQAGTTSIYSGTAPFEVGVQNATSFPTNGTFYRAIVKSGIDGYTVFDADFAQVPANALRMTESSLNAATVSLFTTRYATINRSTSGRKSVAVTQPTWLFGTDDYMEVNNRYMASGTYLYLPGVNTNYASAPDSAAISITGDIDLRVKVALDDWTPSANNMLLAKYQSGTTISYAFFINTTGRLALFWSANGTTGINAVSTVSPTIADGSTLWVRVTLDVNNGASGNDVVFYTSTDGSTWTQLGTTVTTAGTTSIFDSTAILEVGTSQAGTSSPSRGKFFRAQVLNGIGGTIAFDANFETSITSLNQTSFTESSANAATVTINRSGSAYRSAGITAAGYLYPGATNTFKASATDLLNFGASDSFTAVAVVRQWATVPTGTTLAKNTSLGTATIGYALYNTSTLSAFRLVGPSGTTDLRTVAISTGTLQSSIGTRNTVADTISLTYNSSTSSITDPTSSLSNFDEFRIGRLSGSGTSYNDMELYAAAVFRSVLTATQIRQIVNYFANREVYL